MENTGQNITPNASVGMNDYMKGFILEISKWAKFLSIIGFIGIGLMVLAAIVMMVAGATLSSFSNNYGDDYSSNPVGAGLIGILYIIMAVLYFFPVYYLFKSAVGLKNGIINNDEVTLTDGFQNLKSHYKFIGIMMIIIISLYALLFLFAMLALAIR